MAVRGPRGYLLLSLTYHAPGTIFAALGILPATHLPSCASVDAIAKAHSIPPDLLCSYVQMPRMCAGA